MAITKCQECGKEISSTAKSCPHCGKKDPTVSVRAKVIAGMVVLILCIWFYSSYLKSPDSEIPEVTSSVPSRSISCPTEQLQFQSAIAGFPQSYRAAKNEIQKSDVFNRCNAERRARGKQFGYQMNQWVGKIESIQTDQGGDHAYVKIVADVSGIKVAYQTMIESFLDIDPPTMLQKGTVVYNQVGGLSIGDLVRFQATFIRDNDRGLREMSITEEGCVTEPEFLVRFQEITRY